MCVRQCRGISAVPVTAGIVADTPFSAIFTGLDIAAQGRGAAMFGRGHRLELGQTEMSMVGCTVGPPGNTEDIGDLDRGAHGLSVGRLAFHQRHQPVEGPATAWIVRVETLA